MCLRGRAFRNIRKYTSVTVKSALLFFLDYQGERSTPFLSFRSELVSAVELGSPVALLRFSWCFYDVLLLEELLAPTRGYSSEFSVGVCRPVLQILTLFQTKICHFPHLCSDLCCSVIKLRISSKVKNW